MYKLTLTLLVINVVLQTVLQDFSGVLGWGLATMYHWLYNKEVSS